VSTLVVSNLSLGVGGLPDGSVTTSDLADTAVTSAKLADASVTAAKLDGAQSGSAPVYGARAWVNFDGSGTISIEASGNVASLTDHGIGDFSINFATNLEDVHYAAAFMGVSYGVSDTRATMIGFRATGTDSYIPSSKTTSTARFNAGLSSGTAVKDVTDISIIFFR
jgi:hypothetical protein